MKSIVLSFVAVTALLLSDVAASVQDVRVALKSSAVATARQYVLGDVADVLAADPELAHELAGLTVGQAPRPGYPSRVPRAEFAHYLRLKYPQLADRLAWEGAASVTIESTGVRYDRQAIVDFAARELRARLEAGGGQVDVQPSDHVTPIELPPGDVTFKVRDSGADIRPAKRLCVTVDVLVDGAFYRSVPVWFSASVVRNVLKARRDLPAGQTADRQDFEVASQDVTDLATMPLAVTANLAGLRLKRPLAAGAALQQGILEVAPAISRGEDVTIELASQAIRLEAKGVALSEALIGQSIRVKTSGNEILVAKVVAPGVVSLSVK